MGGAPTPHRYQHGFDPHAPRSQASFQPEKKTSTSDARGVGTPGGPPGLREAQRAAGPEAVLVGAEGHLHRRLPGDRAIPGRAARGLAQKRPNGLVYHEQEFMNPKSGGSTKRDSGSEWS